MTYAISRRALGAIALLAVAGSTPAVAQDASPTVVELFTSQGCSSCPPADALLGDLRGRKDVVALGFHVNYWDRLGWADPFASAASTGRQHEYSRALGRSNVYTPQMVIGGTVDVVGSRRGEVEAAIQQKNTSSGVKVALAPAPDGSLAVTLAGVPIGRPVDVMYARYDISHATNVARGENADRRLSDFNVVREFARVNGIPADGAFTVPAPGAGGGAAVWVQERGPGAILGAAKYEPQS